MSKAQRILTILVIMILVIFQTHAATNPAILDIFSRIHNVSDEVLSRIEKQTAQKQEYLLSVTLGFTLFECILLVTSLILHVVSVTVLKNSRIIAS